MMHLVNRLFFDRLVQLDLAPAVAHFRVHHVLVRCGELIRQIVVQRRSELFVAFLSRLFLFL